MTGPLTRIFAMARRVAKERDQLACAGLPVEDEGGRTCSRSAGNIVVRMSQRKVTDVRAGGAD